MNLNKVFLIGRLTQDPETRSTPSGQTVCNFSIATNRVWTNRETSQKQEETQYHNIVLWRRLAEIASQYLKKGNLILVEGRIQTRSWQGADGNKRYRTEIIGENIQLGPRTGAPETARREFRQGPEISTKDAAEGKYDKEDIPVIEEDSASFASSAPESETPEKKPDNDNDEEKEIDVKDIPF